MKKNMDVSTFYFQNLQFPTENRRNVIGFLFICMDFIGLLPLLSIPFFAPLFWAGIFSNNMYPSLGSFLYNSPL